MAPMSYTPLNVQKTLCLYVGGLLRIDVRQRADAPPGQAPVPDVIHQTPFAGVGSAPHPAPGQRSFYLCFVGCVFSVACGQMTRAEVERTPANNNIYTRRLQDPLAELVKIEPKAIGVGQYQHDVNQSQLARKLDAVVEEIGRASCRERV